MTQSSGDPLPVTIIGGYLGSGKTTLINHLLNSADGCKYAVLVNDFGELSIDAQLIESQDGDVISLSGGCVCCSYGNDLTSALMELNTDNIDQVVIEASGVALPGSIAGSLSLLQGFVTSSDVIAINKVDLSEDEQLNRIESRINDNYPSARLIRVSHANYPLGLFVVDTPQSVADRFAGNSAGESHQTSIYTSFVLDLPGEYDVQELAGKLTDKAMGVLRAKGFVRDAPETSVACYIVQPAFSLNLYNRAGVVIAAVMGVSLSTQWP